MLEPDAGKLARTVLSGGSGGDAALLPDPKKRRTMSEKASPRKGSIPTGAVGLAFSILFCIEIAVLPVGISAVLLGGALGLAGLVFSLIGIAKGSGRVAGAFGILAFLLGCLMMYAEVLDIIAYYRAHRG